MRVMFSFVAASAALLLANGNGCTYDDLTDEAVDDLWDCVGVDPNTDLEACDPVLQDRLEDAVATYIYEDSPDQCKCIYYDDTMAFTYKVASACWKVRQAGPGLKCWTTGFSDYVTSGNLAAHLDAICPEIPAPDCEDDADKVLEQFPMTCNMFIDQSGGCSEEPHALLGDDHGYATVADICKGSCNSDCPNSIGERDDIVCEDDPDEILKAFDSSCVSILEDPELGCADSKNIVMNAYGVGPAFLCPASCEPSCQ